MGVVLFKCGPRDDVGEGKVADAGRDDGAGPRVGFGIEFVGGGGELGVVANVFGGCDSWVDLVEHCCHFERVSKVQSG